MENFSKFFDSILSGNSESVAKPKETTAPTPINNDNNICNSNNINNSGEQPVSTFPIEDYYLLSNEIILSASKLYNNLYGSALVPYPFIAYYYSKVANASQYADYYLKKFLVLFNNKQNNIANGINIFSRAYSDDSEIKFTTKNSHIPQLSQTYSIELSNRLLKKTITYSDKIDDSLRTAVSNLRQSFDTIESEVQTSDFKLGFLEYVSTLKPMAQAKVTQQTSRTRSYIAPPKQEKAKKVSNIFLPKIKLKGKFPVSQTYSRIDSAYFSRKFIEGYRSYDLVKKYGFRLAKYTAGFEEKRIELFNPKKSAFDLF